MKFHVTCVANAYVQFIYSITQSKLDIRASTVYVLCVTFMD